MHDYPAAARAERAPDDDLALARCRPREQQQRHVAADQHHEHQPEDLDQYQHHAFIAERHREHLRVRLHLRLKVPVRVREIRNRSLTECREFRLRLLECGAVGEPSEHGDGGAPARSLVGNGRAERQPRVVSDRESEAPGHHPHHGGVRAVELHGLPDDCGVARKARMPHVVSEDHHRRRFCPFVRGHERTTQKRRRGGNAEPGRGNGCDVQRARLAVTSHEVARDVLPRAHVGHRSHGLPPHEEVVQRARFGGIRLHVPVLQVHYAVTVRQRQRGVHGEHGHLEDDAAGQDGERHSEAADDGQPRVLHEHADAEPEVEIQSAEPGQAATVAHVLLVALHAAERDQGLPSALVGLETLLAHEALGLHLEMEAEFLVHTRLCGAATEQEAHARAECFEPVHGFICLGVWRQPP